MLGREPVELDLQRLQLVRAEEVRALVQEQRCEDNVEERHANGRLENIASAVHEDSALHCKRLGARSVLRPLLYDDHPRDEMPAAGKKCLRPSYRDGLCIGCDERAASRRANLTRA